MFPFVFGAAACSTKQQTVAPQKELMIAKTVPANYRPAGDSSFKMHQDTVYYGDHYFTGYRYSLYENGDTAELQSYFNGVEEGFQKRWYPNRQPAALRFYINGKKEGTHQTWWEDGKPKMSFTAYHNEYEGEFREWYASGLPAKDFHYVNGQEEGSEKLWWSDGKIRANYVIRDGKKYGLLGLKICMNPYDSISKK